MTIHFYLISVFLTFLMVARSPQEYKKTHHGLKIIPANRGFSTRQTAIIVQYTQYNVAGSKQIQT